MSSPPDADVPVIDLSALRSHSREDRLRVARRIAEANERVGFLVVTGHGVDPDLIARMHVVSEEFFALPHEVKERVHQPSPDISRGWIPPRARSLAASGDDATGTVERDWVEYFAAGPDDRRGTGVFDHANLWPAEPVGFRSVWTDYFTALEGVANTLLRGFALGLDVEEDHFEESCADHCSVLFANGYPPVADAPEPHSVRLGAHTDYGSLTILYRDENPSGLQVHQDGEWRHVADTPGAFVVNIGDLMARWTDDRWVSTVHRVANPPVGARGRRRISVPFFHQPRADAVIEAVPTCVPAGAAPRYPAVTSGEHFLSKTTRSLVAAGDDGDDPSDG